MTFSYPHYLQSKVNYEFSIDDLLGYGLESLCEFIDENKGARFNLYVSAGGIPCVRLSYNDIDLVAAAKEIAEQDRDPLEKYKEEMEEKLKDVPDGIKDEIRRIYESAARKVYGRF